MRRLVPMLVFCLVGPVITAQSLLLRKPYAVPGQQTVIPNCPGSGEELRPPSTLTPNSSHVLSTTLDVTLQSRQVPVYVNNQGTWTCSMQTFNLRLYTDPVTGQPGYPGPTMLVTRQTDSYTPGDQIQVLLKNSLPPDDDTCTPPAPDGMNCFHGDNTTNLHFHGTHVSPQKPQDYVLLELKPNGDPSTGHGDVAEGQFQYAVNPLPSNQAEGTHWYHPHKHGSTAQQVGNGMAGAVIIKGPFDDWLKQQFGGTLREKLLVLQQVHELNFTAPGGPVIAPLPLVNGQLVPQITMYKGEIQRWRLVNANTDASAQFLIDFNGIVDSNLQAMQIAMDGVQFSPTNYKCQPLMDPTPCDGSIPDFDFQFSPGNRADFLIKAPTAVGEYFVPYDVFGNIDEQGQALTAAQRRQGRDARKRPQVAQTRAALDAVAAGSSQPALLSINVIDCPQGMNCDMQFPDPANWPALPDFLRPITPKSSQEVQFQIVPTSGVPPAPSNLFGVWVKGQNDNKMQQFRADCAAFTELLDPNGGEEWTISQNVDTGQPFHVFHIHTNPFQVVSTGDANGNTITYPEPIWQDSITLPTNKNPTDPDNPKGSVVIRQRFEDYTGMYVLHCHFLGHEDRGMMVSVQTVCPNQPDSWSVTSATQKECTFGEFTLAKPPCSQLPAGEAHAH